MHPCPGPGGVLAGHVLEVALLVQAIDRIKALEQFAAAVIGVIANVFHVAGIDPDALLADRRARIAHRLGINDQAFRAHFIAGIHEGLSQRTAMQRCFPVGVITIPVLRNATEHGTALDKFEITPGQQRVAGGPGIGQIKS